MSPSDNPTHSLEDANGSCLVGQERGETSNADALEKPPGPGLAFAFALQIWLQVDKACPGKLNRAVLICCYGYKEGKQFPVRYLLITPVGCWGRLAKLRGDGTRFCWRPNDIHFDLIHGVTVCQLSQRR